jgi:hypothetical protein
MMKKGEINSTRTGLVNQQRQRHAEHYGDGDHTAQQQQGVGHRRPKGRVCDKKFVIGQPDKTHVFGLHQVVADDGKIQRHQKRNNHPQEQRKHGRCQQHAGKEAMVHNNGTR